LPATRISMKSRRRAWRRGAPHRIDALDAALEYIGKHDKVWKATGTEIVEAFLAQKNTTR
jgi:hypothetical protein